MTWRKKLHELRLSEGLTRVEMGKRLGCSGAALYAAETNHYGYKMSTQLYEALVEKFPQVLKWKGAPVGGLGVLGPKGPITVVRKTRVLGYTTKREVPMAKKTTEDPKKYSLQTLQAVQTVREHKRAISAAMEQLAADGVSSEELDTLLNILA